MSKTEIGDFLKTNFKACRSYVFTGNPELAEKVGLKAARKIEFFNGKLDCRLMKNELYDGSKREAGGRPVGKSN